MPICYTAIRPLRWRQLIMCQQGRTLAPGTNPEIKSIQWNGHKELQFIGIGKWFDLFIYSWPLEMNNITIHLKRSIRYGIITVGEYDLRGLYSVLFAARDGSALQLTPSASTRGVCVCAFGGVPTFRTDRRVRYSIIFIIINFSALVHRCCICLYAYARVNEWYLRSTITHNEITFDPMHRKITKYTKYAHMHGMCICVVYQTYPIPTNYSL